MATRSYQLRSTMSKRIHVTIEHNLDVKRRRTHNVIKTERTAEDEIVDIVGSDNVTAEELATDNISLSGSCEEASAVEELTTAEKISVKLDSWFENLGWEIVYCAPPPVDTFPIFSELPPLFATVEDTERAIEEFARRVNLSADTSGVTAALAEFIDAAV